MSPAKPQAPPDWFAVSVLVRERKIRLSFDGDTYVRYLDQAEVLALIAELRRCLALEDPGPGPGRA